MTISSFDDLLRSAREQSEPQRLLFVFATAGLPDDATNEQRARFESGQGGTLTPLMCVDKVPDELPSFDALVAESRQFDQAWDIVFVAAMSGRSGTAPTSSQAEAPLQGMVDAIKAGRIGSYIPFDGQGQPVQFT
ncbi:MAG: ribonucleotide reductase subunit alpha [Burkholderiaceae bacterium]|nr:ribonucleotide reductase subunit alpha [Burkholderiaceae bacterium]